MIRHSASTVNRSSPPLEILKMEHVRGDCFCLRYLLSDESWRITLTQKTMEMDFCVVFCDSTLYSMSSHRRPNLWTSYIFWIFNRYNILKKQNNSKNISSICKNISNLLIGCICCVSEFSWCDCFTFSSYLNGRQYWHWKTWPYRT
jgi:hypothetical protein